MRHSATQPTARLDEDTVEYNSCETLGARWYLVPPSFVLGFTMCGYAFDEILDPRLQER